jgi:hypothetical protein
LTNIGHFLINPLLIAQVDIVVEGEGEMRKERRNQIVYLIWNFNPGI